MFLFKPFTGLTVNGDLLVEGTQEHPVIFTSINDGEYNTAAPKQLPNPFDWNGILVQRESGTVSLKNFSLRFSVYGIKSQVTDILIDNGLFRQNGQFHFTIRDKIQYVQDNIPFSYNTEEPPPPPDALQGKSVPEEKKPTANRKPAANGRSAFVNKGVPAIIAGTGVASGVVSLVFLSKWANLREEYRETADPAKARKLEHDAKLPSQAAIGTGAVSIAAMATGAALYRWWNMREGKPVAITPVILPGRTGAMITITLRQ